MHRSINTPPRGLTWLEILIVVVLGGMVATLCLPALNSGFSKRVQMTEALAKMRQLQLATKQYTLDNEISTNPVRWTCSNTAPLTLDQWKRTLSPDYLSEADLKKILSVKVDRKFFGTRIVDEAFSVFAVNDSDPDDTVLFATKNWHGPKEKELSGEPYGTNGIIVYRKGRDGRILLPKQITNISLIGSGGMHEYLPLK